MIGDTFKINNEITHPLVAEKKFSRIALARYNNNGSLDLSFGNNGKVIFINNENIQEIYHAMDLTIQQDGKIIIVGRVFNEQFGKGPIAVLARLNANGDLDKSFGDNGFIIEKSIEKIHGQISLE